MASFKCSLLDLELLSDSFGRFFKSKDTLFALQDSLLTSLRSFPLSEEELRDKERLFLLFVFSIFRFCWGDSLKADELSRRFSLFEAKLWEEGNLSFESFVWLCLGAELGWTSSFFSQALLLGALMPENTRQAEKQISSLRSFCLWFVILSMLIVLGLIVNKEYFRRNNFIISVFSLSFSITYVS